MRKDIIISGFGGQGIILAGVLLAHLAEAYPDIHVAQAQNYGPASRGGSCRTDVVFSSEPIAYPKSVIPDVMIFMSPMAVERYLPLASPEKTLLVYDSTLISEVNSACATLAVPATGKAESELGNRMVANIFMLGAVCDRLLAGCADTLCGVVGAMVPGKHRELNMQAFRAGQSWAAS